MGLNNRLQRTELLEMPIPGLRCVHVMLVQVFRRQANARRSLAASDGNHRPTSRGFLSSEAASVTQATDAADTSVYHASIQE